MKLLRKRGSFDFDHTASVTDTFSYSLDKIEKISPTAVELLRFCAFLHPDAIPEELIINGASELGSTLQPVASDPFLLDETLVILRKFSFVHRNSITNTLSIHRLVQAVLQDSMGEKTRRLWAERTVRAVNLALPDISDLSMWQRCRQYMPHVQKSVSLIEEWKIVSPGAARLLEQTGMYLQIQAQYTQAFAHFEQASDIHKLLAETDPAITIASYIYLFKHNYYQGKYVQADQPIRKALRLVEQTPGSEALTKAICFESMAYLSYQQGKYSHAEDYFLEALVIYEQCIGLQHPLVVCTYCGLGNVNLALAKYDRAESFFKDALDIWQQMPKPQHPFMYASLNGLAHLSIERGKYGQAELYLQQERSHLEQTLQPLHPALAHNLNDYALLYIAQGKYNQVEPFLRQSLKILEQSDSLRHPFTGYTLDTLGRLSYLNREYPNAEQLFQKAQNILEQALGCEHPEVLNTINNLADVYVEQDKLNLAEELYKEVVLAKRIRIFGSEHPSVAQTFQSMAHLSYFRGKGYYEQSEQFYNRALIIHEEVLGREHPAVAQTLHGLAEIYYRKWKKFEQAESLFQRAIAIYEKAQLLDHPELAQILRTYAILRCHSESCVKGGRKSEAAKQIIQAEILPFGRARSFDSTLKKEGAMPVPKKKRITAEKVLSLSDPSSPLLPEQQAFHQHLRTLAQSAVRTVLELVMREELDAFIGAAWGECSPKRRGYRNGTYTRDLATATGRLEEIKVPRDREGHFHSQAFERYSRYEPHIAEGLTQMFVAGVSTHKVGEVAQTLMGIAPSASTVSRLNQSLTQQYETWRQRALQAHWRVLYLDGVHFSIRHGEKADATIILTALGVDLEGNKEVLALHACAEESKEGWLSLLQDLRTRGATQIDLIVTDGHDGLLVAVGELFAATPRQRCLVHKQRNVLAAIPRRERSEVQAELVGIWEQATKLEAVTQLAAFKAKYTQRYPEGVRSLVEDEEHLLTFYQFPLAMHRHIQTTNAIESLFSNVRQRTDQIDVFTTETSCLTIVWATIEGIALRKVPV